MSEPLRQRQPREHDSAYMAAVAKLPCIACLAGGRIKYGVHVAHVREADVDAGWRYVGKAEKPDDVRTLPLCPGHHLYDKQAQHKIGEAAFYDFLGIRPSTVCAALKAAYDRAPGTMFAVMVREVQAARNRRYQASLGAVVRS